MQIKMLKDLRWSFKGNIRSFTKGQAVDIEEDDAQKMITYAYAEVHNIEQASVECEDKMLVIEVEEVVHEAAKASKVEPKKKKKK